MISPNGRGALCWSSPLGLSVLGVGAALPGTPVSTEALLAHVAQVFGVDVRRRGGVLATRLGIQTRYISRALGKRFEGTRRGHTNAELAAEAVALALRQAGAEVSDLDYLIAHTATPGELIPPNVTQVARLLNYAGPYVELRQACTGFANALVFASGLLGSKSSLVAIVGSETGSVYFDPVTVHEDNSQLVNLVQMGDGAAAVVLGPPRGVENRGLTHIFLDSAAKDAPRVSAWSEVGQTLRVRACRSSLMQLHRCAAGAPYFSSSEPRLPPPWGSICAKSITSSLIRRTDTWRPCSPYIWELMLSMSL